VKSQRAYVEHILECLRRISEDAAPDRDAVFGFRTPQDAILRNLQLSCESTQRIDEPLKQLSRDRLESHSRPAERPRARLLQRGL
jgi:uncharacterized protein with HEPN domain